MNVEPVLLQSAKAPRSRSRCALNISWQLHSSLPSLGALHPGAQPLQRRLIPTTYLLKPRNFSSDALPKKYAKVCCLGQPLMVSQ